MLARTTDDIVTETAVGSAYITSTGAFLPGPPIGVDEVEDVLGMVDGIPSRLKARILRANGIRTRHYALDRDHRTTHTNEQMAAEAARTCLRRSPLEPHHIGLLACATSQGDLVLPGFGSMVQAQLGIPQVELHTTHGICSCGTMALKTAVNGLRLGEHDAALVVSSELASPCTPATKPRAATTGWICRPSSCAGCCPTVPAPSSSRPGPGAAACAWTGCAACPTRMRTRSA